ncbi:MAG: TRAP transporter substrate-binding protein [Nitrospirae bacterium]|nr:MAG: TRAP transporter substrate-binding protein [Nitrospirota bacterium]
MKRRDFLKGASIAALAGATVSINAPFVHAKKRYLWKMVTTWPPHFPVLGEGADLLAKWISELSGGRLRVQVYGGGELVPPLQAFDAVSQGTVEMGHGAAYYWAGKSPATQFFTSIPFGMNAQQMNAWIYSGGGLKLWEEVYAPFNLIPMPVGNTGVQMGGWFNREINSIKDIKGLKMRIPGLGGKVISKAGGAAVLSAGGEIYTNLERGVIDATEWVGPYHDYLMGFYKVAKYYYYPGWHEPGSVIETFINKKAYEKLPSDLKEIIRTAAARSNAWMLSEFEAKNNTYLKKLLKEHKVKLLRFPDDVLKKFKQLSQEVITEVTEKDPLSKKVYKSFSSFQKDISEWAQVSEAAFYNMK